MRNRRSSNDGWTYEETPGVGQFRWRIVPQRFDSLFDDDYNAISDDNRALLAQEAGARGMTLLEYVDEVARMSQSEMYRYRDLIRAGAADEHLKKLHWVWIKVQQHVREVQMLLHGEWG